MKQARYKEPLPLAVIEAARAGDAGAVEQVLQYYNGYINKLCKVQLAAVRFVFSCRPNRLCAPCFSAPGRVAM